MFKYYFSNTWTDLGCSGASLYSSGVEIELFSYNNILELTQGYILPILFEQDSLNNAILALLYWIAI